MGFFKNVGEKLDGGVDKAKTEIGSTKSTINGMDTKEKKVFKYAIFGLVVILILAIGSCSLRGCGTPQQHATAPVMTVGDGVTTPMQQVPVQQIPMIANQGYDGSDMALAIAGGAIAGYIAGKTLMPDGSIYNGSDSHKRILVNNYYTKHPEVKRNATSNIKHNNTTLPTVSNSSSVLPRVRNPGDAAAEIEKQKMAQEQARMAQQERLKQELRAKQQMRSQTKSAPSSGGFKSFSRSVSRGKR